MRDLLRVPLDWPAIVSLSSRHHIEPLLHKHLSSAEPGLVSLEALASIKTRAQAKSRWNLFLTGQLFELAAAFQNAGIPAIPYKGPTLAAMAYGNIGLRPSQDLDFAFPQRYVSQAFDVLGGAGYHPQLDPSLSREVRIARADLGEYCFTRAGGGLVELHTEKTLRYFPAPPDWDALRNRLETVSIGRPPGGHLLP